MSQFDVIIIGAGAAGMMAAGTAAEAGARVLLLEKMERPGRKLRITGKGRCNLTNVNPLREFLEHVEPNPRFLKNALVQFSSDNLIDFLSTIGIETVTERGNRVFPASQQATEVVDKMHQWLVQSGVTLKTHERVTDILIENNQCKGVKTEDKVYYANAVIVATGGKSYPATGSTGDGYRLAKSAGHTIIPPRPALVPLVCEGDLPARLEGLSLKNVNAILWVDQKKVAEQFGEMVFTSFGVSGPIILTLSRQAVDALLNKHDVKLSLDLKPALDHEKLDIRLIRDLNENGKRLLKTLTRLWLPGKLAFEFPELTGIDPEKLANQISAAERKKIRNLLKDLKFSLTGFRPYEEAIVTAGGIALSEIDQKTMMSKLVNGLFFAGETMDINADTGGYNLQIAFSTGRLAALSAINQKQ